MSFEPGIDPAGSPPQGTSTPERVRLRPRLSDWSDDEILTLPEVVALFWPDGGPVTLTTIRTAVRDGDLDIARIAGKFFTTKAAVIRMITPRSHPAPPTPPVPAPTPPVPVPPPPTAAAPGFDPMLERIRARRRRAKSRP